VSPSSSLRPQACWHFELQGNANSSSADAAPDEETSAPRQPTQELVKKWYAKNDPENICHADLIALFIFNFLERDRFAVDNTKDFNPGLFYRLQKP
jgi:hypothetical protein